MTVIERLEGALFVRLVRDAGVDTCHLPDGTSRPCTAAESALLTQVENQSALTTQVGDSLTVLRTSIDSLQLIVDKTNANIGPADTKQVARECRRVARQVLALSRLFTQALESSDTGSA